MQEQHKKRLNIWLPDFKPHVATLAMGAVFSPQLFAEASPDRLEKDQLSKISQYTSCDTFESSGSFGLKFGMAYFNTGTGSTPNNSSYLNTQRLFGTEAPWNAPESFTRVSITKGTFLPIDGGIMMAVANDTTRARQWGGHLQWTIFEKFRLPTLALRLSRIETLNLQPLQSLKSDQVFLGTSFAPIPYLTISGAISKQLSHWGYFLTDSIEDPQLISSQTVKNTASFAIKVQPFTPFLSLGYEKTFIQEAQSTESFKLTLLL